MLYNGMVIFVQNNKRKDKIQPKKKPYSFEIECSDWNSIVFRV